MLFIVLAAALAAETDEAVRAELTHEGRSYVLTQSGELQIWQDGALVSSQPASDSVGLFVAGGRVWREVREVRAVPVEETTTTVITRSAPAPAVAASSAKVLRVDRGVALIDRGSEDGLNAADELRFLGTRSVIVPSMEGRGEETREVERVVAAGRIRVLEPHRALVDLGRGGRVAEGDRAEVRPGAYGYPVAPERLQGFREVGVAIRPLLALDTVGFAMVNEAWLTVGFEAPWYVTARFAPIGIGWSKDGNPLTVAGLGTGGYDSRYFSVGLGAGWSRLNTDTDAMSRGYAEDSVTLDDVDFEGVESAFAFVQEARLGARDGLHVGVRNTLLLVPGYAYVDDYDETTGEYLSTTVTSEGEEFVWGGIAMDFAIPTGDRTDLFLDWGTGRAGATWVEGGVSSWIKGNGDRGSLGLRVGAGYAEITGSPDDQAVSLYGPMVSVGARYRF